MGQGVEGGWKGAWVARLSPCRFLETFCIEAENRLYVLLRKSACQWERSVDRDNGSVNLRQVQWVTCLEN